MHIFLSYAKSHIYELHAAIVAVVTIFTMYQIKAPIKRRVVEKVDSMLLKSPEKEKKRRIYIQRGNGVLIFLAMVLAFLFFSIVALISPLIHFSVETGIMSGVFALAGYAFWDQITYGMGKQI